MSGAIGDCRRFYPKAFRRDDHRDSVEDSAGGRRDPDSVAGRVGLAREAEAPPRPRRGPQSPVASKGARASGCEQRRERRHSATLCSMVADIREELLHEAERRTRDARGATGEFERYLASRSG
jgi:hypothetical protein